MRIRTMLLCLLGLVVFSATGGFAESAIPDAAREQARRILKATGVAGGLVAHVGCGSGRVTAALHVNESFLVHGLCREAEDVREARRYIRSQGLYGPVSVMQWDGGGLPYVSNVVNLLIAEEGVDVARSEIMRVLSPRGVAYMKQAGGEWRKKEKPWPDDIDEWPHYLYDASNNAVSRDAAVAPPRGLQWTCGPKYARSHEHFASVSGMVSEAGRVFYIQDSGPISSVSLPARWELVARDAFSGVRLWTRTIENWESALRGFRSGPPEIGRRMVAAGGRLYVAPEYGGPVTVLDGATGVELGVISGSEGARELLCHDGKLYVLADDMTAPDHQERKQWFRSNVSLTSYRYPHEPLSMYGKQRILACDAATGRQLWCDRNERPAGEIMPATMAVSGGRVCFQTTTHVVCLDADSGEELWHAERPVATSRYSWSTPTLVIHDGVVISGDRMPGDNVHGESREGSRWIMDSHHQMEKQPGEIIAFSLKDGERLWEAPAFENYTIPMDIFVIGDVVWTGDIRGRGFPGFTTGRSLTTGEVAVELPHNRELYRVGMGHNRCYRNKATCRYIILGRDGIEFIDPEKGTGDGNWWVRGTCQYGVMPANGMIYVPQHSCACHIAEKITGFNVLSPESAAPEEALPEPSRFEKGPAYGMALREEEASGSLDWPAYRCNPERNGYQDLQAPHEPGVRWTVQCSAPVTQPVCAGGRVYIAETDQHVLRAFDAGSGEPEWSFAADGRIDSPPSISGGRCVFGTRSGSVYCLDTDAGELVWRFRAAPRGRLLYASGRLESAWPIHGSVLIDSSEAGGLVYFAAGRSSHLDGGIRLYCLDIETGEVRHSATVTKSFASNGESILKADALPDILSMRDGSLFMRQLRLDRELRGQRTNVPHLFSPAGFLDDTWWHRTYWVFGTQMSSGWGGWPRAGNVTPAGRLLVFDDEGSIYGYGRQSYRAGAGHVGPDPAEDYRLFAEGPADESNPKGGRTFEWSRKLPFVVRAMTLTREALLIAGGEGLPATDRKGSPGIFRIVSRDSGDERFQCTLPAPPVLDGMAVTDSGVFVSTVDGKLVCLR